MKVKKPKLRPPYKTHGGKFYSAGWIIDHLPAHYERLTYVEPFAGAASVLLQKRRSCREVVSDLDVGVYRMLTALRDRPTEFIARLRDLDYVEETFDEALSRQHEALDGLDAAVNAFVLRRMSRGGLQRDFAWSKRLRGNKPGDLNAWETALDMLPAISDRLQGVEILNADGAQVIEEYDGPDTLIYADPPYVHESRKTVDAYRHEMTREDHVALAGVLKRCRGRVVLSGYPSALYDDLFRGWRTATRDMPNNASQSKKKKRKTEVIWMNWHGGPLAASSRSRPHRPSEVQGPPGPGRARLRTCGSVSGFVALNGEILMDDLKNQDGAGAGPGAGAAARLTDALTKWSAEAGAAPAALEEVRIDQNERLLVPFTTSVAEVTVHFLDYPSLRGYVHCNGPGCLLCRLGRKADVRDLWPVYDVVAQAVGVLPVAANLRPQALKPQLAPVLKRLAGDERLLLAVSKLDRYRYRVAVLDLPDEAEDGSDQIADFLDRLGSGAIDLGAVYQRLGNEELAAVPEVATAARIRGVQP
jgi:DNA adenine methylase